MTSLKLFYDFIDKISLDLYGLRVFLYKEKFMDCDKNGNDWLEMRDFKLITMSEFIKEELYEDLGKILQNNKNIKLQELDKELLSSLCYKV